MYVHPQPFKVCFTSAAISTSTPPVPATRLSARGRVSAEFSSRVCIYNIYILYDIKIIYIYIYISLRGRRLWARACGPRLWANKSCGTCLRANTSVLMNEACGPRLWANTSVLMGPADACGPRLWANKSCGTCLRANTSVLMNNEARGPRLWANTSVLQCIYGLRATPVGEHFVFNN